MMVLVLTLLFPIAGGCWVRLGTPQRLHQTGLFEFLLHGMTSMEAAKNKFSYSFTFSKQVVIFSPLAR